MAYIEHLGFQGLALSGDFFENNFKDDEKMTGYGNSYYYQYPKKSFQKSYPGNAPYEIYPKAHNYSSSDIGQLLTL